MEMIEKIKILQEAKSKVKGEACEVYSRVVGYLRPLGAWNKGKAEEYTKRKMMNIKER
jgi:anaerobic ribonucleoside-triphosphate reductase